MKKIYFLFIITLFAFFSKESVAQTYVMRAATSGQSHSTCQGFVVNQLCAYWFGNYYCEGLNYWEAFTNGGTGPIRINLTGLDLNTGDFVRVYQGTGTGGPLLASYTNTSTILGNFVTSPTGIITIRFSTDFDGSIGTGFTAIVGCPVSGCSGNQPAGDTCLTATRICDTDPYCGNTGGWYTADHENLQGLGLFCGSIENNSWLVFTANISNPTFKVEVSNCADPTTGIQMTMLSTPDCASFASVATCISQNFVPVTFTLTPNTPLTPGTDYYIMIDGFAGNYCTYTVTPLTGIKTPTLTISAGTICAGQTSTITASGATGGSTYSWTTSSPGSISGSTTNSVVVITPTISATYSVTINQPNGCSISTFTQFVVVNPVPKMTSVTTVTVCSGIALNHVLTSSLSSTFSWLATDNLNTSGESTSPQGTSTINNTIVSATAVPELVIYTVTPTSNIGSCVGATQIVTVTVYPKPLANAGLTATLTCSTQSLVLSGTGGGSYAWSGPGIVSGGATATPTINTLGVYALVVTSVNGCISLTSNVTISQNITNPVTSAGTTGSVTCNPLTTINLTSTLAGMNYTWTAPAGSSINSGTNSQNATGLGIGTYSIMVLNPINGCSVQATVAALINTTTPVTIANTTGSVTCNPLTTINLTSTLAGMNYTWTAPAGSSISGGANGQNATGLGAGIYTITLVNPVNGCFTQATVAALINTITPVTTAATTGSVTCSTISTINLTSSLAGMNYTWTAPAGSSISGGTNGQNALGLGAGTYTVNVINPVNGCSVQATVAALINTTTPVSTAGTTGSVTCNTLSSINLTSTLAGMNYTWTAPAGSSISGGTNTQNTTGLGIGTYSVVVLNPVNGCSVQATVAALVNTTTPVTTANTTGSVTCNTLGTINLTSTLAGMNYTWTAPAGSSISGGTNGQNALGLGVGTYTVKVLNTINGCSVQATVAAIINTTTPVTTVGTTGSVTCNVLNTINLTSTLPGMSYTWTAPAGSAVTTGTNSQNATGLGAGTYSLMIINPVNSCSVQVTVAAMINTTTPITTAGTTGSITCNPSNTITLTSTLAGMTYSWTAPGGSSIVGLSTLQNGVGQGLGTYTLIVINPVNSCTAMAVTTAIQNTTSPTGVSAGPNQTITCAAATVTLTGNAISPIGTIANWLGGVSGSTSSFTTTSSSAGVFTLQAISPITNCITTSTVQVFASAGFPSVTTSPVTNSITCTNTLVPISITTTSTPISILWSGPVIVGSTVTPSTTVSQGGVYTVVVMNTLSLCSTTLNVVVPSNTLAINTTATISPTSSITCTTPVLTLNANPAGAPYTYVWTGPGIISGGTTSTPNVNIGGNYIVTITNSITGCSGASATKTIVVPTNTAVPIVTISPSSSTVTCATPTVQLIANSLASPLTYTWISSGGSLTSNTIFNPTATAGSFSVFVTNTTNGCVSSSTAIVVPDANAPAPTINPTSGTLTCNTSSLIAIVTVTNTAGSNLTYSWTPSPFSGITTSSATINSPGTYICAITNTVNGCPASIQIIVSSNTVIPTVSITPTSTLNCAILNTLISTTVTPSIGLVYNWTGPGISGSTTGSSIIANSSGGYSVTIKNAASGCSVVATSSIISNNALPTLSVTSTSSLITCASPTLSLNATSNSTNTIVWSTPTGTASNPVIANTSGSYSYSVTDPTSGCTNTQVLSIIGSTISPTPVVTANTDIPCGVSNLTLSASSSPTNGVSYLWTGPGSITNSTTSTPTITQPGLYSVAITDTLTGCSSTATVDVSQGNITAVFTADPTSGIAPLTVNCTDLSINATNFNWTFGNGSTSTLQNPNTVYNSNGTYTIMLIASNGPCSDTAYATIIINDGLSLEIPNVFTPNEDGVNDFFTIKSTGIKEITLNIFNRWGQKLYEFSGPKASWDGISNNGIKVPDGTYFYFVKAIGYDEKVIEKNGSVNLFR